jgi:two-component system, response regulator YesN
VHTETKNIDPETYNICLLIHKICRLDVEFIDVNRQYSFELFASQIPSAVLQFRNNLHDYLEKYLQGKKSSDFVYHVDNLHLSYVAVGLWRKTEYRGTIIVGPFLSDIPDEEFVSTIIKNNSMPLGNRPMLQQFYKSVVILDANGYINIGNLLINICSKPFIIGNALFSGDTNFSVNKKEISELSEKDFLSAIELRYTIENELLNAVEKGLKEEALKFNCSFQFSATHRVPNNPLRAYKNLSFSFNTMLRIAANRGGVSPLYIHNLSDKFAILIERISSMSDIESLKIKMISEYCELVKNYSTAGYSSIVKNAVDYINLNFDKSISLSLVSENIVANASHLSRQFRKETGVNITDFINRKRIEEAKFLLKQNKHSITDIALLVGFENHNYFSTVFKQITGLTPKEYKYGVHSSS